jgi:hypothetical protein
MVFALLLRTQKVEVGIGIGIESQAGKIDSLGSGVSVIGNLEDHQRI